MELKFLRKPRRRDTRQKKIVSIKTKSTEETNQQKKISSDLKSERKWWKFKIIISILIIIFNNYCIEATKTDDENININFPRLITTPTNRILKIDTKCTSHNLSLNITMEKPFKGVIFAKDFPQECKTLGIFEQVISLNLPTRGCGVRLASSSLPNSANINNINDVSDETNNLHYTVTVIVQMDRHLRQITDQERTISCTLDQNETKLHSNAMRQAIMEMMKKDIRTARMKSDWSTSDSTSNLPSEDEIQILDESRAWMEILGDRDANPSYNADDTVKVGDTMTLTVKSTLPENIGWRVINCMAHDGIGDSSQKLLDDFGCPVDEQILPELKLSKPRMIGPNTNKIITKRNRKVSETVWNSRSKRAVVKKTGEELKEYNGGSDLENSEKKQPLSMMRYQEASAKFSAFKFPDRDRLHLSCGLQLCKGKCQQIDCKSLNRASRHLVKKKTKGSSSTSKDVELKPDAISTPNVQDEILDTLEVYNSVEVIAPDIELDDYRGRSLFKESTPKRKTKLITNIPGDRTFCVSTNKMALTFCILGVIFIIAVVVAIISLLRSRRKDIRSYYSRSVFSSSTSTGSGFGGSKLLLHESPCLGVARSWQYGRAF